MSKENARFISAKKKNIRDAAKEEALRQIQRISDTMEHMKVSPAEVAKETGLSRQTVYRVISGAPAKLETVIAIDSAVSLIVRNRMEAVSVIIANIASEKPDLSPIGLISNSCASSCSCSESEVVIEGSRRMNRLGN
jgi:predicted transcriptional regulator